jgi:nucleotide-binding universal stress UspA family protein
LRALDAAANFALGLRAALAICHVVDLARAAVLSGGQAQLVQGCLEELQTEGAAIVADAVERIGTRIHSSTHVVEGMPADAIVELARQLRPSFIVIGSRGRTGLEHLLLGSVAEGVVRSSPVPVMVVPKAYGLRIL